MPAQSKLSRYFNADTASFLVILGGGAYLLYEAYNVGRGVKKAAETVYKEIKHELEELIDDPQFPVLHGAVTFVGAQLATFYITSRLNQVAWYKKAILGGLLWINILATSRIITRSVSEAQQKLLDYWYGFKQQQINNGNSTLLLPGPNRDVDTFDPFTEKELRDIASIGYYSHNMSDFMCYLLMYLLNTNLIINEYIYAVSSDNGSDKIRMTPDGTQLFIYDDSLCGWMKIWDFSHVEFSRAFTDWLTNAPDNGLPGQKRSELTEPKPVVYY